MNDICHKESNLQNPISTETHPKDRITNPGQVLYVETKGDMADLGLNGKIGGGEVKATWVCDGGLNSSLSTINWQDPIKVTKGLIKKKTHKGAKGGRGRERSISGGRDGKTIQDINSNCDPTPHIQKTGRPQIGFHFSQPNGGVEGQDESWDGLEREKGSGGRDRGSMGARYKEEAVPDIKRDYHQTLHIERNNRPKVGFGVSQANGNVERRGGSPNECRDVKGKGSRSGANQAQDGEGKGSSLGESQGQDGGEGSASRENQGGDRNAEGSRSSDDEDERERERQRSVRGDIEHRRQESNQEEIDFSSIPETFMAIIGAA
nr:hypothetical protein CFP56_18763 [Quercus suber]